MARFIVLLASYRESAGCDVHHASAGGDQCRRLASTRRPVAYYVAYGPTDLSSCWPGGPTSWQGVKLVEGARGVRNQDVEHRPPNKPLNIYLLIRWRSTFFLLSASHRRSGRRDIGIATYRTTTTARCRIRIRIRINFIFTQVAVDTNNILQYSFKHEIIVCKSMNIIYCTI